MTDTQQHATNNDQSNDQNNHQNNDPNTSSQAWTNQPNPDLSAEDIQKLNAILGDIDTDEGLDEVPDQIDDEAIEEIWEILFGNKKEE